jgi:hypothetical protein
MFEVATREKFRFESTRGTLTVEDLWDVPLTGNKGFNLDNIARTIYSHIKDSEDISFVSKKTTQNNTLTLKLDIVKYIIQKKLEDAEANEHRKAKADKNAVIRGIIQQKEMANLAEKDIDELKALLVE